MSIKVTIIRVVTPKKSIGHTKKSFKRYDDLYYNDES